MVDRLAESRFLAVVGSSGCGKSSLVNCGLRPGLSRGLMAEAGSSWRIVQFRPGANPIQALASALAADRVFFPTYEGMAGASSLADVVAATLRMSRHGLVDICELAQLEAGTNVLFVVDQFEELFRYRANTAQGTDDAIALTNLLLEASSQRALPLYVALTMRSDFLGDCAQLPGLPEAINRGQYLVPRMTREERRRAISGPIAVGGATITPMLLTRLVNDVGDNPDQLSILQHALNRTWAQWARAGEQSRAIDVPDYEAIGTMSHALDQHATRAFQELTTDRQRVIAATVFKALTDKGTDARGVRRPTRLATLCAIAQASAGEVEAVIDVFRKPSRSFLMPPLPEPLLADTVVDISHESLMRLWGQLRDWSDEESASAAMYTRLAQSAELHARGEVGFLVDPELSVLLAWRKGQVASPNRMGIAPNAAWGERHHAGFDRAVAFLDQSVLARDEERRATEARRAKATRRNWATLGVIGTVLLVAAIAAWSRTDLAKQLAELRRVRNSLEQSREQLAFKAESLQSALARYQAADSARVAAERQAAGLKVAATALVSLAVGGVHACSLTSTGKAACWGSNQTGELADGTTTNRPAPTPVRDVPVLKAMATGMFHTCGLSAPGDAYCWGYNRNGQVGDGSTMQRITPKRVRGNQSFTALSAGYYHTCGLTSSGDVYCWGQNEFGQLGDGSTTDKSVPVRVNTTVKFTSVTAGGRTSCGLTTSGVAYCWGENEHGAIGDGTTTQRLQPVAVAGGHTFRSITAGGEEFVCGLSPSGMAFCWGWNDGFRLGDGTSTDHSLPTAVAGRHSFIALTAGSRHACGLTSKGEQYCWGANDRGQLGDGRRRGGLLRREWQVACSSRPSRSDWETPPAA